MGRGGAPAREISFVSLMAYGPKVSDSALAMGASEFMLLVAFIDILVLTLNLINKA